MLFRGAFLSRFCLVMLSCFVLVGCVTEQTRNGKPVTEEKASDEKALEAYIQLANSYLKAGKREQAIQAIEKGLAIDADSGEMLNVLGFYYGSGGDPELADKQFSKAISANSDYTAGYLNYGVFLYGQKRYDEACKMFAKAAEDVNYGNRGSAFSNLATCLRQVGDVKGASAAAERSLSLDPRNPKAQLEVALSKFEQGEFIHSRGYYDEYLKSAKQTPRSLWLGIKLMHISGEDDKKASYALFLKNEFPSSPEYLEYKAWSESQ
jgi:type IV pilus assembly protein PilF